ncbi:MAG TPA: hypothetical protein VMT04_05640 [Terriglobales bacterium]|nr:hypothetical protein [Terriglobales bacterium]
MTESSPETKKLLDDYLQKLKDVLRPLPEKERDEIVLEIKGHIQEKLSQSSQAEGDKEALMNALIKLGKPEEYGSEFVTDYLLSRGIERRHAGMIFKGLIRWGCNTLVGFFYSLFFFVSYSISLSFVFIGIMKPIFQEQVGFFLRDGIPQNFGFIMGAIDRQGMHEVLGYWIIPITLIIGIVWFFATTWLLKKVIRNRFGFWRKYQER